MVLQRFYYIQLIWKSWGRQGVVLVFSIPNSLHSSGKNHSQILSLGLYVSWSVYIILNKNLFQIQDLTRSHFLSRLKECFSFQIYHDVGDGTIKNPLWTSYSQKRTILIMVSKSPTAFIRVRLTVSMSVCPI